MKHENFGKKFHSLADLMDALNEFRANADISPIETAAISVVPVEETSPELDGFSDDVKQEVLNHSRILLRFPGNQLVPLRKFAMEMLLSRAGLACPALREAYETDRDLFARDVTKYLKRATGNSVVYTSFGMVAALGSAAFIPIEMAQLVECLEEVLSNRTSMAKFDSAYLSHEYFTASWVIDDPELVQAYNKEVSLYECEERDVVAVMQLTSSNTQSSGVHLSAFLLNRKNNVRIPCGHLNSVIHKGDRTKRLEAFKLNCETAFSRFVDASQRLTALLKVDLDYPLSVMKGAGKRIEITGSKFGAYFAAAYNEYARFWGPTATNAHEVYWGLAGITAKIEESLLPEAEKTTLVAEAEQCLCKLLAPRFPWESFDVVEAQTSLAV